MAYTVKLEAQTVVGNMMQATYYVTGTGTNFTITPNCRILRTEVYNVTGEDQQAPTTIVGASGVYTITPAVDGNTTRVTFTGVPN